MASLGNQTLANDFTSYYLRAGSIAGGVPSPFAVVDETGGILGSKVVITSADDTGTLTNVDASGNTTGTMTMGSGGGISFATTPTPVEGYNLYMTGSNARFTKPLIVQSGTQGGVQITNNPGTGLGILSNSVNAPGQTPANIVMDQIGNVVVGGTGNGTAATGGLKVYTYNGGANSLTQVSDPGSAACVQTTANTVNFLDSASVTRGSLGLAGQTQVNLTGRSVAVIVNRDQTPFTAALFDASGGFTTYSNATINGGLGVASNLSVNGDINMDLNQDINMNNGQVKFMSAIPMNNGGVIGGVGTINMVNSSGFASGTITGLSNIPTAGGQPILVTGYNPGFPTPLIQLGSAGGITNTNAVAASVLNGVILGQDGNNNIRGGAAKISCFPSVYYLDATSSSSALVSLGDRTSAGIYMATNYFVFGNNQGNVFDFFGCPAGKFWFIFMSGEGNHAGGIVYWTGATVDFSQVYGAGGGSTGPSGGNFQVSVNPVSGVNSRWDYAYTGHAASGQGFVIMFRLTID